MLVINQTGKWGIWPPKIEDATRSEIHERRKYVYWRGDAFEKALLPAAQDLYWRLGGLEGRSSRVSEGPAAAKQDCAGLGRWMASGVKWVAVAQRRAEVPQGSSNAMSRAR